LLINISRNGRNFVKIIWHSFDGYCCLNQVAWVIFGNGPAHSEERRRKKDHNQSFKMSADASEFASIPKDPVSEDVHERPQDASDSASGNDLAPGEFSVDNVERIYK
jgi:hypothetical protein